MGQTRFWIGVVSKEHVSRGVAGGFAQVCHGKCGPLQRMKAGDWFAYYSPASTMRGGVPYRSFTAIGRVVDGRVYEFDMGGGFVPYRIDIAYLPCTEAEIAPLIERLTFIKDKKKWGFPFRRGHFEISATDFSVIATALGVDPNEEMDAVVKHSTSGSSCAA